MVQFISSILIINHPNPKQLTLGAHFVSSFSEASDVLKNSPIKVVVFPISDNDSNQLEEFLSEMEKASCDPQKIVILENNNFDLLKKVVNSKGVFHVLNDFMAPQIETVILEALKKQEIKQQPQHLLLLANEQNERLRHLSQKLEDKVKEREIYLKRSHKRLFSTTKKIESLHRTLLDIQKARSGGEMESLLFESLKKYMNLEWSRIFFGNPSPIEEKLQNSKEFNVITIPLKSEFQHIGRIVFAKNAKEKFKKSEVDFLNQVAEVVALSVDHITKMEQSETLKQQWEATFDSISVPLCLTSTNFDIFRTNLAYSELTGASFQDLQGKNCFEALNKKKNKDFPLETPVKLKRKTKEKEQTFEVVAHKINVGDRNKDFLLIFFRDITEQTQLEEKILESAKMAELGTIGSSIAHELNNPLGGMISFLQLLRMDKEANKSILEDISHMEEAALRCKEIVENLLGFSRNYNSDETQDFDLRDVLSQSIKIVELQTRAQGVKIELTAPEEPVNWKGHFNQLSQAFCKILQTLNSDLSQSEQGAVQLTVDLSQVDLGPLVQIKVPSSLLKVRPGSDMNLNIGLSMAHKIISSHFGHLDFYSQTPTEIAAKISFKRPDLNNKSQVFDSEI